MGGRSLKANSTMIPPDRGSTFIVTKITREVRGEDIGIGISLEEGLDEDKADLNFL